MANTSPVTAESLDLNAVGSKAIRPEMDVAPVSSEDKEDLVGNDVAVWTDDLDMGGPRVLREVAQIIMSHPWSR